MRYTGFEKVFIFGKSPHPVANLRQGSNSGVLLGANLHQGSDSAALLPVNLPEAKGSLLV